jgi:hypothetical protein
MATKEQIKKVILDIAGDPSVGEIYTLADKWADAIVALDVTAEGESQAGYTPIRETRITKPTETR